MKPNWMAMAALALLAASAPEAARGATELKGIFGAEFGTSLPEGALVEPARNGDGIFGGVLLCGYVPPTPWPTNCAKWVLAATPVTRRVAGIGGLFPLPPGADAETELLRTVALFEHLAGAAAEKEADGAYRIRTGDGNRVDVLFPDEERSAIAVEAISPHWEEEGEREERELEAEEAVRYAAALETLALRPVAKDAAGRMAGLDSVFGIAFGEKAEEEGPILLEEPFLDCQMLVPKTDPASGRVRSVRASWPCMGERDCFELCGRTARLIERATGRKFAPADPSQENTGWRMEIGDAEISIDKWDYLDISTMELGFARTESGGGEGNGEAHETGE